MSCSQGVDIDTTSTGKTRDAAEDAEKQPQQPPGTGGLQGVAELADMDDWGSAWQDAKDKGESWGGRGKGGRGVKRNTWQPKDVYVEGKEVVGRDERERGRRVC